MSKRSVHFDETAESDKSAGKRRFKEKHSLDSDEEDDEKEAEEVLNEDDIEGQEEGSVDYDEGIQITPFNMREELEEGHFDKDGTYIFDKDGKEIRDEWMDNINWVQIKEVEGQKKGEAYADDSDSEPDKIDQQRIYSEMLKHIKPGETVAKALRRLGGNKGKRMSSSDRWKAKKQKTQPMDTDTDIQAAKDKEDLLVLTGLADQIVQGGNMEVYEMTCEKLNYELKKFDKSEEKMEVPEDLDEDDALDMFADDIDNKKTDNKNTDSEGKDPENNQEVKSNGEVVKESTADKDTVTKSTPAMNEVMWEYKWENNDKEEIHGPHTSTEMLNWTEDDYFKKGVYVRKVGTDSQFYSSKRIDFDLYT